MKMLAYESYTDNDSENEELDDSVADSDFCRTIDLIARVKSLHQKLRIILLQYVLGEFQHLPNDVVIETEQAVEIPQHFPGAEVSDPESEPEIEGPTSMLPMHIG